MPVTRNWRSRYAERRADARDALLKIGSGCRLFLSPGCGEPQRLREEGDRSGSAHAEGFPEKRLNAAYVVRERRRLAVGPVLREGGTL
jgi:hypothetical protein